MNHGLTKKVPVSVVIPVFNVEEYLRECMDSVLGQSLREIEVVCVDDGSTDGSGTILDEYAARDARVKVVHQKNAGVAAARNLGIDMASGDFIAFMDPDDKYPDSDVLSDLVCGAISAGVDVAGGSLTMIDGRLLEREFTFEKDEIRDYADYQFEYGFYRYIYRRCLLSDAKVRFPNLVRFQDVPFCVAALHAAKRFLALRRIVYLYRDGHHPVEWSKNDGRKAIAHVKGLMMTYDLAVQYGYGLMAERLKGRLLDFVKLLCSESNGLSNHLTIVLSERDAVRSNLEAALGSESYRLGLFLTWPIRKIKKIFKEN